MKQKNSEESLYIDNKNLCKKKAKERLAFIVRTTGTIALLAGFFYFTTKIYKNINAKIKYTSFWFKNASLNELNIEREKVWKDFVNPNLDLEYRSWLWRMLQIFDQEINNKQNVLNTINSPAFHREHGWYLPNND